MMNVFVLATVLVAAHAANAANVFDRTFYEGAYQDWLAKYEGGGRVGYLSVQTGDQHVKRLNIFADNHDTITKHNKGNHTWTMSHNQFSDRTWEEFQNELISSPLPTGQEGLPVNSFHGVTNSPSSVDWRAKGCVTEVKSQQCGDCWAFSSAAAVEGASCVNGHKLMNLSPQQLVDCDTNNNGCRGGLRNIAFNWVKSNGGMCSLTDYPYRGGHDGNCDKECTPVAGTRLTGWSGVGASEDALVAALSMQPVSVGVHASQDWSQFYHSGVYGGSNCGTGINHGVLAVGYGGEGKDRYYIVKNSWGKAWGENGYIRFAREGGSSGTCEIQQRAYYPTM